MKLDDPVGLEQNVRRARELGFDGKSAIHPAQVAVINSCFSPDLAEVRWARSVVAALSASNGQEIDQGASVLNGELVEAPHLLRAQRILETAKQMDIGGL
jgi:citrate lyase beta subunit